jgi:hypothetical protein
MQAYLQEQRDEQTERQRRTTTDRVKSKQCEIHGAHHVIRLRKRNLECILDQSNCIAALCITLLENVRASMLLRFSKQIAHYLQFRL